MDNAMRQGQPQQQRTFDVLRKPGIFKSSRQSLPDCPSRRPARPSRMWGTLGRADSRLPVGSLPGEEADHAYVAPAAARQVELEAGC